MTGPDFAKPSAPTVGTATAGSGEPMFEREISTYSKSTGGDGADRLKGNARLAIMTNLASAVLCLDKGAYQRAPADCALSPAATYRARQPATVVFGPR